MLKPMQPPKVKVAVVAGAETIRLRSEIPFDMETDGKSRQIASEGEIRFTLQTSQPAPLKSWFWCGVYGTIQSAEKIKGILNSKDLDVKLWSVGLTPVRNSWQPRDIRLLVDAENESSRRGIVDVICDTLPGKRPIEIRLPIRSAPGTILIEAPDGSSWKSESEVHLSSPDVIELIEAPIGRGFHWEHSEILKFPIPFWIAVGSDGKLCAGTEIELEDYLKSVNSSEMPAESPPEFLKTQAVAARSWLFANWGSHHPGEPYTVCSGDHCQCYFGLSRVRETSRSAVEGTAGEVLVFDGRICDARYAKSCGGVTEPAANVWTFVDEEYLGHIRDLPGAEPLLLSDEAPFREFQMRRNESDACCAPGYGSLAGKLSELGELYRWEEEISAEDLRVIIHQKSGRDLGNIRNIFPKLRGPSGRLIEVEIDGSKAKIAITPELEIRRILSRTHLPSSAFWIEKKEDDGFRFHGMGWGHGAGMCQIGAAALAANGFDYTRILAHYYPSTSTQKIY